MLCHQGRLKTFKRLFSAFAARMLFAVVADGKFAQLIQSVVYFFLVRRVAEGILCHIQAVIALYGLEPSVFGFAGLRVVFAGKLPHCGEIAVCIQNLL